MFKGGFEPRQPPIDEPFFHSKFMVPLITASVNGPVVNSDSSSKDEGAEPTGKPDIEKVQTTLNEETTTTEATKAILKKGMLQIQNFDKNTHERKTYHLSNDVFLL